MKTNLFIYEQGTQIGLVLDCRHVCMYFLMYFDFFYLKCFCVSVCTTMIIYLYVFYNIMLDIGERATELMFPV